MKKTLVSFLTFALIAVVSAGAVYAWFSSQGKVEGIGVSVGSSGLLINGLNEWVAGVTFDNIVPGWESDVINLTIQNDSDGNIPLQLKGRILFTGSDFEALAGTMKMAIQDVSSVNDPDFQTLTYWNETDYLLEGGSLSQGESRDYQMMFRLPRETDDNVQGSFVDLSVLFTGVQVQ